MIWLIFTLILTIFITGFYQLKLVYSTLIVLIIQACFFSFNTISYIEFFSIFLPSLILSVLLNIKKFRRRFISKHLFSYFTNSGNSWKNFQRIDNGWFASDFEKSLFQGNPEFISITNKPPEINNHPVEKSIFEIFIK